MDIMDKTWFYVFFFKNFQMWTRFFLAYHQMENPITMTKCFKLISTITTVIFLVHYLRHWQKWKILVHTCLYFFLFFIYLLVFSVQFCLLSLLMLMVNPIRQAKCFTPLWTIMTFGLLCYENIHSKSGWNFGFLTNSDKFNFLAHSVYTYRVMSDFFELSPVYTKMIFVQPLPYWSLKFFVRLLYSYTNFWY